MAFNSPDASPFFSIARHNGDLVIFVAHRETVYSGDFGESPAVIADVTIASGENAGTSYNEQVLINAPVVKELVKFIGKGPVLARIRSVKNTWVLDPTTVEEQAAAEKYAPAF
jgi:hypothetical protein